MGSVNDVVNESVLFLFDKRGVNDYMLVFNKLIVTFDSHYLNFIRNRKERDGYIIFKAFSTMLGCCRSGFLKKEYLLSSMFSTQGSSLVVDPSLYPVNIDITLKNIVNEISMMKAVHFAFMFFCDSGVCKNANYVSELKENIDLKIKKVANLSDRSILQRVTDDEIFVNNILSKIECFSFDHISMDHIYYTNVINDINLFLASNNKR